VNKKEVSCEVLVVGRGISGVSSAWNLCKGGVQSVIILGPDRQGVNCTSVSCQYVSEATVDNITRINHQYGVAAAEAVLTLGREGFENLKEIASTAGLPWVSDQVERLALSEHEYREMLAAKEIHRLIGRDIQVEARGDSKKIFGIQKDGLRAASTDVAGLLNFMEVESGAGCVSDVLSDLSFSKNGKIKVSTSEFNIACQMILVCAHLNSGKIIPNLSSALASYSDQCVSIDGDYDHALIPRGGLRILKHGHYTVFRDRADTLHLTGARFLRHNEGAEATQSEVSDKVTQHLVKFAGDYFGLTLARSTSVHAFLECRPCDELPIIGPMYGDSRVLTATGYSGSGLALGFSAGRVLSEYVLDGTSSLVNFDLAPNRLRSL
jgi:glycine/D-amino acid oxidase-like deaminating enzyme